MKISTIIALPLLVVFVAISTHVSAKVLAQSARAPAAHTQQFPTLSLAQANAAVQSASNGQAHVLRVFRGEDGLVGVIIEGPAHNQNVAWLTTHGKAVVIEGTLIGSTGQNLTQSAMYSQGLLLKPDEAIKQAASVSAHGILVGTKGPVITVFFDPNCIYCHLLYKALAAQVDAGKVRVRYVVVGTLKPSSIPRAVSMLAAVDPAKALALDEAGYDKAHEEGGYPIAKHLSATLQADVEANNVLFSKSGAHGTPAILYCSKSAKAAQFAEGVPGDIAAFVADTAEQPSAACR